jgi:hypothetical protein
MRTKCQTLSRFGEKITADPYDNLLINGGDGGTDESEVQDCGSGSVSGLDPDSIGSVDPDSESGSGPRRAKMTHKSRNFFFKFMASSVT